jgi:hypothetical protein
MGVKISNLPIIGSPSLTDVFPIVQSGVTYQETFTQLGSLFAFSGANSNITSMTGLTGYLQAPLGTKDANGNINLHLGSVASSVNYITVSNNVSGSAPEIGSFGTDPNVSVAYRSKGTGAHQFISDNTTIPIIWSTGTTAQHTTNWSVVDSNNTRTIAIPDQNGTLYLANKANGTEAANAVTASGTAGVITTSALTTASGAAYAITWTNTFIASSSVIILSIMGGTNTKNTLELKATAGSGTSALTITNNNAAALDGTVIIGYIVIP